MHDAVLQALNPAARRVFDIGCGTGELARRIRDEHPSTAVCRLPFRDGSFDVVISTEAFHWFPDQDAALREACRVLAPGGRLLLALIAPPPPAVNRIVRVGSRLVGEPFYWPTRSELSGMLERAGFRVENCRRLFRFPGILLPALTTAVREPRRESGKRCARGRQRPRTAHQTRRRARGGALTARRAQQ